MNRILLILVFLLPVLSLKAQDQQPQQVPIQEIQSETNQDNRGQSRCCTALYYPISRLVSISIENIPHATVSLYDSQSLLIDRIAMSENTSTAHLNVPDSSGVYHIIILAEGYHGFGYFQRINNSLNL